MRILLPFFFFAFSGVVGCASSGDLLANEGFEIDCRGVPCEWDNVTGNAKFGPTWHDGDTGVDLSAAGRVVVEQKSVLLQQTTRVLELEAAVVRSPGVKLRFELDWYAPGIGIGKTFWERAPTLLASRPLEIHEEGVTRVRRTVSIPSEAAALVFRIVKEGEGTCMVDELSLGRPVAGRR